MTGRSSPDWWIDAFRGPYLECYAHRDDASAETEAQFVASLLGLAPGARILDAGCGGGRHARAFARRGAEVVGVDRSEDLLREASRRGEGPRYVLADVRRLPFENGAFAHVASLFTSFGYFDEAGDRAHLADLRRVLARGGSLVLDFLNAPRVIATLVPESERTVAGRVIHERRRVRDGRVEKHVEIVGGQTWTESVRLYGRSALTLMLSAAGLRVTATHGDLAGGAWSEAAERLVLVAVAA